MSLLSEKLVGRKIFKGKAPSRLYPDKKFVKLINRISFLLKIFVINGKAKLPMILNLKNKIVNSNVSDKNIVLSKKISLKKVNFIF